MISINDYSRTNQRMIHFKKSFRNSLKSGNLDWVFKKLDDINMKIESTNYLKLHQSHLIGNTALHLIYDCRQEKNLSVLLSQGADFTIKNQNNLTILHTILRFQQNNQFRFADIRSKLDNNCVDMVLSAHLQTKNPTNPCDGNGMSHFHVACMANNVQLVMFFLDNNVPIDHTINTDSPYFAGFTGLHLAIRCCCLQVVRILLKHEASIHLKNAEGMTAYHMVIENYLKFTEGLFCGSEIPIKNANEEIAKLLLEMASNSDMMLIDNSGLSCFHLACTKMNSSIAEELAIQENINDAISVDSPLWPGYTALHFAALVNTTTVEILIKRGADLLVQDVNGITPLDICMQRCKTERDIHVILSPSSIYKAIAFTRRIKLLSLINSMRDCRQFQDFLNSHPNSAHISVIVDAPIWAGFTPLHFVVLFSRLGIFHKFNFEEKFWTKGTDKIDRTFKETTDKKYLQMILELYNRNPKIITVQDIHGRTPLHLAFCLGKQQIVIDLLLNLYNKLSSPGDLVNDEDLSLLHVACSRDNKELVEKLLTGSKNVNLAYKGKSITYSIETGWTPLHVAVASDSVDVIQVLLEHGADVHSRDVHDVTPTHLLILRESRYRKKSAASLLSVPNLKECVMKDIGLSHLHVACYFDNADAVKKLLASGSDVNLSITSDPKAVKQSFELSILFNYLGYIPLQMTKSSLSRDYYSSCMSIKRSKTFDLMTHCGANIFIAGRRGMPFVLKYLGYCITHLKDNVNLQRQAEDKIGLTSLHLASFFGDVSWLKTLLDGGVNVNAKLNMNLPKFGGFTPLHVILNSEQHNDDIKNEFVKLLLSSGSDIIALDAMQRTPLHIAYSRECSREIFMPYKNGGNLYFVQGIAPLKAQKNLEIISQINPTNFEGLSHLHIACHLGEADVVKELLERANLNVNQPTDFFIVEKKRCVAGCTALHFAAISGNRGSAITSELKIVDLLLKHGADPDFQNSRGETPLHVADRNETFERIARESIDVNLVDNGGDTPLGSLFTRSAYEYLDVKVSADQILNRLRCGCYYNAFNIFTEKGYIGQSIDEISFEELQSVIKVATKNMPHTMQVDGMGRTAIHNVVACYVTNNYCYDASKITIVQYASLIEMLADAGLDIDSQDNLGRTALHLAAKHRNLRAIDALLMVGADVNIPDKHGKTALAYHIAPCQLCKSCIFCNVLQILAAHVLKLQICHLDVSYLNISCITNEFISTARHERLHTELEEMKNWKIEPYNLTLKSLISEIDAVAYYPTMPQCKKDGIGEFFSEGKMSHFREKYNEVAGLLSLQYRKAMRRAPLIEEAMTSLNVFAKFPVPYLCSRIILGLLSNSDLKNLITSTKSCQAD